MKPCQATALIAICLCGIILAENHIDESFYHSDAFFPILAWGSIQLAGDLAKTQEYYDGLKECGFTLAGFAKTREELDFCAAAGLKCYLEHPALCRHDWKNPPDDQELEQTVAPVIAQFNDHP
ncbi:MAG: hypothetical protein IKS83_09825, partial [Victivallales bacterium]|nr:hypothetical protein [Victivallales bacterium]